MKIPEKIKDKLKSYKDKKEPLAGLHGGGCVVGEEIDDDNRLIYVVRKDNKTFMVYAEEYQDDVIFDPKPRIEEFKTVRKKL